MARSKKIDSHKPKKHSRIAKAIIKQHVEKTFANTKMPKWLKKSIYEDFLECTHVVFY